MYLVLLLHCIIIIIIYMELKLQYCFYTEKRNWLILVHCTCIQRVWSILKIDPLPIVLINVPCTQCLFRLMIFHFPVIYSCILNVVYFPDYKHKVIILFYETGCLCMILFYCLIWTFLYIYVIVHEQIHNRYLMNFKYPVWSQG